MPKSEYTRHRCKGLLYISHFIFSIQIKGQILNIEAYHFVGNTFSIVNPGQRSNMFQYYHFVTSVFTSVRLLCIICLRVRSSFSFHTIIIWVGRWSSSRHDVYVKLRISKSKIKPDHGAVCDIIMCSRRSIWQLLEVDQAGQRRIKGSIRAGRITGQAGR